MDILPHQGDVSLISLPDDYIWKSRDWFCRVLWSKISLVCGVLQHFTLPWASSNCVSQQQYPFCFPSGCGSLQSEMRTGKNSGIIKFVSITYLVLCFITGGSEQFIYKPVHILLFLASPCVIASDKKMLWFGTWRRVCVNILLNKNAAL